MKSVPIDSANAQSEGDETKESDISLNTSQRIPKKTMSRASRMNDEGRSQTQT